MDERFLVEAQIAHRVLPRLWIGTEGSCGPAKAAGLTRLCVHEALAQAHDCVCLPILVGPNQASRARIDRAVAWVIGELNKSGPDILVHCGGGQERAGLVALFTVMSMFGTSVDDAYDWLRAIRPQIKDRRSWVTAP